MTSERKCVELLESGKSVDEICTITGLAVRTVRQHLARSGAYATWKGDTQHGSCQMPDEWCEDWERTTARLRRWKSVSNG